MNQLDNDKGRQPKPKKKGMITYKQKDKHGHFRYTFKITNYQAAKILEYIAYGKLAEPKIPRDKNGRFKKVRRNA